MRDLVVISAGLSTPSSTRLLADRLAAATEAGVTARGEGLRVRTIEVRDLAVDLARAMTTGGLSTPALDEARRAVSAADGLVVVTPVFAASYAGLFKMFVDILDPDAVTGMPTLIAATAGTPRHALVLDHALRPLLTYLRAVVVPTGVFAATDDFGGRATEPGREVGPEGDALGARITRAAGELAALLVRSPDAVAGFTPGGVGAGATPRRDAGVDLAGTVTPFEELLGDQP